MIVLVSKRWRLVFRQSATDETDQESIKGSTWTISAVAAGHSHNEGHAREGQLKTDREAITITQRVNTFSHVSYCTVLNIDIVSGRLSVCSQFAMIHFPRREQRPDANNDHAGLAWLA